MSHKRLIISHGKTLQPIDEGLNIPRCKLLQACIVKLDCIIDNKEFCAQKIAERFRDCEKETPVLGDPVRVETSDDIIQSELCLFSQKVLGNELLLESVVFDHAGEVLFRVVVLL